MTITLITGGNRGLGHEIARQTRPGGPDGLDRSPGR